MRGPDVYGPAEACQLLGISRQRLHELRKGDTFPPETRLEIGAVFDGPALRAYDKDRRAPKKARAVSILASYRKTGAVKTTARNLGINHQTVRRVLRDLGEPLPAEQGHNPVRLPATLR